jgi:hypothetical protein
MRSSNTYIYNSFPIPIRRLWIFIYTSTIESTKLSCHIFIVISSQNFMLYRMFQICFSIIFPRYFFGWICFPHVMFLCFPYVIFSPLNFPRIFYMIFCSFFLHCTWWFPILYGTWFFLFFSQGGFWYLFGSFLCFGDLLFVSRMEISVFV